MAQKEDQKLRKPESTVGPAGSIAQHRVYAKQRIPEVVAEMRKLGEERQTLLAKRKDKNLPAEERKKVNQRWTYLMLRGDSLRSERKQLSDQLGTAPTPSQT